MYMTLKVGKNLKTAHKCNNASNTLKSEIDRIK